ncbi:MAG: molybdopterin cofactor-binding domain-containing protein, partial [Caulobacterales bacterium]
MADQGSSSVPRFVGQSIGRKENRRFLTGRGKYVDDHSVPGMLYAHFVRSPMARAKIEKIDISAAKALPGVYGVFLAEDINPTCKKPLPNIFAGDVALDKSGIPTPLAEGEVGYVGDPVVIIVAEDRYIAEDAADLVEIDYDPLDPIIEAADAKNGKPCLPHLVNNVLSATEMALPGSNEAFESAATVVKKTIAAARAAPSPMETRSLIATTGAHEQVEVYFASQNPHHARAYIADVLGLSENDVRVISPDVGGGFGQKFFVHRDEIAVIQASRILGRPVKWVEDR